MTSDESVTSKGGRIGVTGTLEVTNDKLFGIESTQTAYILR